MRIRRTDIPIRVRLVAGLFFAGFVPVGIVLFTWLGYGLTELKRQAMHRLQSERNIKKEEIERYYTDRIGELRVMAENPYVGWAASDLCGALQRGKGGGAQTYSGMGDGRYEAPERYRSVHDRYQPYFAFLVMELRLEDLLILDPETGDACFSILKDRDFAPAVGRSDSLLGRSWHEALRRAGTVLSDAEPYPDPEDPKVQFLATPIRRDERNLGVLALRLPMRRVDDIVGEQAGTGIAGATYIVGPDREPRSDPFKRRPRVAELLRTQATKTAGPADEELMARALSGRTGSDVVLAGPGRKVMAAYAPLSVGSLRWTLMAEVNEEETDERIFQTMRKWLLPVFLASALAVLMFMFFVSGSITASITSVAGLLTRVTRDIVGGKLDSRGDPEEASYDFREVVRRINGLIDEFGRLWKTAEDKRVLEEQLAKMQRLETVGTLASGIAHDFNNILSCMFAHLHVLESFLPADPVAREEFVRLETAVQDAARLVDQILTFSRKSRKVTSRFEIIEVVKETVTLMRSLIPKNVALLLDLPQARLDVTGDAGQAQQVVLNLVTNAYQSMQPAGGRLAVGVAETRIEAPVAVQCGVLREGSYALLSVEDTGCGMAEAVSNRAFDPFFTTKAPGEGTGMGLAVVHGIVLRLGGAIRVSSTPGQGSRFQVYFPLAAAEAPPEQNK
jgi:signal transduction histidine kinase